jgi:GNAT superfamily N-acetyltransferase
MISYSSSTETLAPDQLQGFFVGWPKPPTPRTHLRILRSSHRVVLALEQDRVVGFVNAISDGVLSAYIPLLEVLPTHQGRGIGTELVRRMLQGLRGHYMVDLTCDAELQPFYERLGLRRGTGMMLRDFAAQDGIRVTNPVGPTRRPR